MSTPVSVAVLAAGLGTRMKSKLAKVLHRAGGLCLLEHVVRAATRVAPAGSIVAVVGHQAAEVRAEVERHGIQFRMQSEQKGTGHALLMCRDVPELQSGRLLVLYGDCPLLSSATLEALVRHHEQSGAAATVVTTILKDPHGYGRIVRGAGGEIAAIVEQKAANEEQRAIREINSGIYCLEAALVWPLLEALQPNPASGEIYLTDVVESLNAAGHRVSPFVLEDSSELLGINTRVELAEVDALFRRRKTRELMLEGVTFIQPETSLVDVDVRVGLDTVIEPFVQLRGTTTIGSDCLVGACSVLHNATLEDGAQVLGFSHIDDSTLEAGAQAGPFTRLRNHAQLGPSSKVGNFVELKKTSLGKGAKANHLAYLGDATVGAKANIGAGTITCNYDGVRKSPTAIGEGAFIGSNSTLVAPLRVETGAYVAAGSVITQDVPADALALGRARQTVKPDWARQRRELTKKD